MSRTHCSLTLEEAVEQIFEDPELSLVQSRNKTELLSEENTRQAVVLVKGSITVSF